MNRSRGVAVFDNGKSSAATRLSPPLPEIVVRKCQFWIVAVLVVVLIAILAMSLAVRPFINQIATINADKHRVEFDLDYNAIKAATAEILSFDQAGALPADEWPPAIAVLKPTNVYVVGRDVGIEFGSGFGHYGIVVCEQCFASTESESVITRGFIVQREIADGIFYYESE